TFELHYAARSREECPFFQEIGARYGEQSRFYFSSEQERLTPGSMADFSMGTHLYFCGPAAMVSQFREAALAYGYPGGSIHFELFTPPSETNRQPYQAVLHKSGMVLEVVKDQTLLEALLKAGVRVPYSCRVGACGTCEIEVLAGEVDHRDVVLSDQERDKQDRILTCVSRARSGKIVLNL
ncbi:iron-sulfur cluster-binding domain-containing protein, partial [Frankia sp. Cpl3]|nr:iron-sulfur cluster-binding domain-containing protein [Frankia sp. Cpl3]